MAPKMVEPNNDDIEIDETECGACSGTGECQNCDGGDADCDECEGTGDCSECDGSGEES